MSILYNPSVFALRRIHLPLHKGGFFLGTYFLPIGRNYRRGGENVKKEEKREEPKPITWEAADPPVPVVRSGHMEQRREY